LCLRPTRKLVNQLLVEFNIKGIWYDPNSFNDLINKVTKKTKLIYVENPGSNTFEFQDLGKITALPKEKIYTLLSIILGALHII